MQTNAIGAEGNTQGGLLQMVIFKAYHLTPKNEDDDVPLTNGEGFMTAQKPYKEHLKDAIARAPRYKRVSDHP